MYTLKKSLGQHFLKDEEICKRIVAALQERSFSRLVEVGPGGGALTKYLAGIEGIDFKAIELDKEKVDYLISQYPSLQGRVLNANILEIEKPYIEPFTVIGNFPYNISTEIVFKIIEWRESVETMIGMFQKEVAMRLAAKHGNKVYGVTSVLAQAWFDVEHLFDVPPEAFNPPPKVDSSVIRFTPRSTVLQTKSPRQLSILVKAAFNHRRKTLRNAAGYLFDDVFTKEEIFNKRAEQLSVEQFAELTFRMK